MSAAAACPTAMGFPETSACVGRLAFVYHYVIRAEDLILLNGLPFEEIRPIALEWINRGTDQKLNRMSITMLVRTLYQPTEFSQSVRRLHCAAGLRVSFRTAEERAQF
ncbi:hypothetical protein KRR38_16925 [Novosphingobium sp. G106]|uniref:hypothetical protein n=1 Tax=Novosphingobium sp. G106 TaxID=2849500 RepID=UPI001C2CF1A4|nr:hypothetical protein [Novosphingobium sp. G106]MBV1689311.1 hypothetical protein [Novosphingobium sp. G106]